MRAVIRLLVTAVVSWVVLSVTPGSVTFAAKWDPVDPKELAATQPVVEKDADAEVLLWDVRVADEVGGYNVNTVFSHYLRIKIYTDRGRDAQTRVEIPFVGSTTVEGVEGRSIRRDGSFSELKKSDVFVRDLVKAGGSKVRALTFALPAVEAGGIVEYRWREIHGGTLSQNLRLAFSRDIPVQKVKYHVVPFRRWVMSHVTFHTNTTLAVSSEYAIGIFSTDQVPATGFSMANVPANEVEPHAPPDWEVRPWMLVYYDMDSTPSVPQEYWTQFSQKTAESQRKTTAPTPEIGRAVASLSLDALSLNQKLAALVAFCQGRIKRLDVDTVSDAERKGFSGNKSPTAALAAGRGTAGDVAALFVAMARAAGLDARLALLPSRNDVKFNPSLMLKQLLRDEVVAVRDGDRWRFLDPTNEYAPDGHLTWTQELQPALIPDEDKLVSAGTPAAPPEWSLRSRTATLHLAEDGTLEGDVTTEYTGHFGTALKEQNDHLAPAERETSLKDLMAGRLPGIEMTAVHVDNVTEADKPYTTRYHLKIPGYAQRTGSRMFVQPAVFQKGIPPEFPAATRRYPVFFEYAWKEIDKVRIELPAGYQLESPGAPAPVTLPPVGGFATDLARTPDGRWIEMTRQLFFGGGARLQFPVEGYSALKQFFDAVTKADAQALTLGKLAGTGESTR
jgi:transglutaminase-like putative cysteine protease